MYLDKSRADNRQVTVILVESILHRTDAFLFQLLQLISSLNNIIINKSQRSQYYVKKRNIKCKIHAETCLETSFIYSVQT